MLTDNTAKKIAQIAGDLPTMPHIATLVMKKVADPNASARDLHKIISGDPALASKILKIANSAFYGCTRNISTLTDAIVILGFNTIRSLAIAAATQKLFRKGRMRLVDKLLWEHSIGVAIAARTVAKKVRFPKAEEAFLAGLLHDIGKIVLDVNIPEKFMRIVQEVYNNPGTTFMEAEQEMLGFDHTEVGYMVVHKWKFADSMEEAVRYHHAPEQAQILPILSYILHLANCICIKLEIGPEKNPDLDMTELSSFEYLKFTEEDIENLFETFDAAYKIGKDFFKF